MIFGKNYDEELKRQTEVDNKIITQLNINSERLNKLVDTFNSLQEQVISLAMIQTQHKEMITFLLRNTSVDVDKSDDVRKDFMKMLKNIKDTENKIKDKKK